jgi:hypothetical protein
MTCAELQDVAEELALDLLDGVERAAALAHLETCASCRHEVGTLTEVAEEVLLLAPAAEPSPGFAARAVTQIQRLRAPATVATATRHAGRRRIWGRRFVGLAAAAAIAVLVLVASIVIRGGSGDADVLAAEMRTGTGTTVGTVSLRLDDPATATVSVPGWIELVRGYGEPVDATYWLAVEQDDGSRDLYPLTPAGDSTWVVAVDEPGAVAAVSVLDDEGRVWCSARFTA